MHNYRKKVIKLIISNVPFHTHADGPFRDRQISKFNDIYLFQTAKFMFLYIKGLLPNTFYNVPNNHFKNSPLTIRLLLQTKYPLITLEIQIAFIFSLVQKTFKDFPFVFHDLRFTIHSIKKLRIVRELVCLVNCLKNPNCKIR